MLIGRWFGEGEVARRAGASREACPYSDGEARHEWLAGFDKTVMIKVDIAVLEAETAVDPQLAANVKNWLQ